MLIQIFYYEVKIYTFLLYAALFSITTFLCRSSRLALYFTALSVSYSRSQWPRGLTLRFAAARLLRLWVRIPPGESISVCCECCVLAGRGLCHGLITRPEESYRLWRVVQCDLETSWMRRPWSTGEGGGLLRQERKKWSILYSRSQLPRVLRHRSATLTAEIVGSNPTGRMDVCLLWVSCVGG